MQIHGMLRFDEAPDWDKVTERVTTVLMNRYEVMHQYPRKDFGRWHWVDDEHFDLANHISLVELPDMSDESIQAYLARRFAEPFDRSHPLWQMDYLVAQGHQPGGPVPSSCGSTTPSPTASASSNCCSACATPTRTRSRRRCHGGTREVGSALSPRPRRASPTG